MKSPATHGILELLKYVSTCDVKQRNQEIKNHKGNQAGENQIRDTRRSHLRTWQVGQD